MAHTLRKFCLVSEDAYLAREEANQVRHELVDGVIYAQVGGTDRHARITLNLASALNERLPDRCAAYSADMKLRIGHAHDADFYYPDVMVCCGPSDQKLVWRENTMLLAEVLSPSTERVDRNEKFLAYTGIASLDTYLLIAQDEVRVEMFRRVGGWKREILGHEDTLEIPAINFAMPVNALYRRVEF